MQTRSEVDGSADAAASSVEVRVQRDPGIRALVRRLEKERDSARESLDPVNRQRDTLVERCMELERSLDAAHKERREWKELYAVREGEFQQARSEADDAIVRAGVLEEQLAELRRGRSVAPERSVDAVETLSEVRHLFALAGELRAALSPFVGGS